MRQLVFDFGMQWSRMMTMAKPSAITNGKKVGLWSCQESHIFIKRCQEKSYNDLKVNLKTNEIILHVDFNENYKNQQ